jgi:hypothetical protein
MLVLMNKMLEETGKKTWNLPNLEVFSWRCEFWAYREQFQKILLEKILNITKYTMHPKAFFAIQDLNNSSDLC